MRIIGEKLSNKELLMVKGGCDIDCYCESLWIMMCGGNLDAATLWDQYNCPTGNPGDPGYPGSGDYTCTPTEDL